MRVLVIDDDPSLLRALRVALHSTGHEVQTASNGEQGVREAAMHSPEVLILDLGLPDLDGIEVCRRIRQWSDVPIIVLSATDAEARKVLALDVGADDYVTKPFGMAELEARIRAVRRRREPQEGEQPHSIVVHDLALDLLRREARLRGDRLDLTPKEFDVLAYLARNAGRICTHEMLLHAVWGRGFEREAQYLHAYVHRLRQKLDDPRGELIGTVPGIGYELRLDGDS